MTRTLVSANRPWAAVVGYSRAVRVGNVIEVSATAAADADGQILAKGDVAGQARAALQTIGEALTEAGGSFEDVVRTRVLLTDITTWEEAGRAHGEVFAQIRPANITCSVAGFIDPDILVEIEVTAIVDE
ncbi:MAG TPA: RidA family protein [Actinomycetota bacterium]|nr:RidA family protein [Actinomycetota bacterium]